MRPEPSAAPLVATALGTVRGRTAAHGTLAFLGIPYAAPPLGAARFAAPAPPAPWDGIRDATAHGPTAPQAPRTLGRLDMGPYFGPGWVRGGDYLTVNVWTPAPGRSGLPVMVFVHGGGFVAGSTRAPLLDGAAFARDGVVLVTVGYRLGIPGFLDLPGAPANRGLLDVVAALRWVRENIAAFGGDPGLVTLFGQSAGATLVGGVLAEPAARGLFRRAITQSGNGLGAFSREQAARVTRAAADRLGIPARADAFAEVPDERLVAVASRLTGLDLRTARHHDPLLGLSPFGLVLDTQPARGLVTPAPGLLVGTNSEEGNLYSVPFGTYASDTPAEALATARAAHPDPARLLARYAETRPGATPGETRAAVMGAALFQAGSWALADAAAEGGSRAYAYEFTWRSHALDGALGAAHAVELPFVFDLAHLPALHGPTALLGPDTPPARLARRTHAAWIAFARTGDPGWAPYAPEHRTTMRIGADWSPAEDPHARERRAWGGRDD